MDLVSRRVQVAFWEIQMTNRNQSASKAEARPQRRGDMSMVLGEVSRVCVFSVFFLEIDVNQNSVIEFSVFL